MNNLGLPLPEKIMEALQINTSAIQDEQLNLPTYSQLNKIKEIDALMLREKNDYDIVDVREPEEFNGSELPKIDGSVNISIKDFVKRRGEFDRYKNSGKDVLLVCRSGMRSSTGVSILNSYGFDNVLNLKGGLLKFYQA